MDFSIEFARVRACRSTYIPEIEEPSSISFTRARASFRRVANRADFMSDSSSSVVVELLLDGADRNFNTIVWLMRYLSLDHSAGRWMWISNPTRGCHQENPTTIVWCCSVCKKTRAKQCQTTGCSHRARAPAEITTMVSPFNNSGTGHCLSGSLEFKHLASSR